MRKLDLRNYKVKGKVIGGDGEVVETEGEYNVKDSVVNILFMPSLGLSGVESIRQEKLALKIEAATDEVLLEDAEYERVKLAAEKFPVASRNHIPLINRILNETPEVDVNA